MKINSNMFYLSNIYKYDIESCHYTLLKNIGIDLSKSIDISDKKLRNITIGKLQKNNSMLTTYLRETTNSVINSYIKINNLKEEEIIYRQYDGLLTTKILKDNSSYIAMPLRDKFIKFLISYDKSSYIGINENNKIEVKGISNKYDKILEIYSELININYLNKMTIFKTLNNIKQKILTSSDTSLYLIPVEEENKFNIYLYDYGLVTISKFITKILDKTTINRFKYFEYYLEPFTKAICKQFLYE